MTTPTAAISATGMSFRAWLLSVTGARMALRVCNVPGCPRLQPETRCAEHRRQAEQKRGTRQARGYDRHHEAERKRWAPLVAAGRVKCWRCGETIVGPFDLGHDDEDRSKHRGPEHPSCNRAAPRISPDA